jgi:Domain of unknown function (DUF4185)
MTTLPAPVPRTGTTRHSTQVCRAVAAASVVAVAACSPGAQPHRATQGNAAFVLERLDHVERVAQLTGADSINHTDRVEVAGQDLGSMFEAGGKTWFVFGDTFGKRTPEQTGGGGEEWRSNTLAFATDQDPANGITFDGYITDERGWAREVIPGKKVDNDEMTIIPTYGFAAGGAMYLHYMSVRHWGEPGEWETNYAGLAKSTDQGRTWTKLSAPRWGGESNFVQVSVTARDGDLYFWGVTHGRFGGVKLMKVAERDVEEQSAYRYFTGTKNDVSEWSPQESKARTIVNGTVGELSVAWNDYLSRWLMTSTDGAAEGATIREGVEPWGPWSEPITFLTQDTLPGLYAPYLNPRYVANGGRTVYFTISQWGPYQVFWYRADLVRRR